MQTPIVVIKVNKENDKDEIKKLWTRDKEQLLVKTVQAFIDGQFVDWEQLAKLLDIPIQYVLQHANQVYTYYSKKKDLSESLESNDSSSSVSKSAMVDAFLSNYGK